LITGAAEFYSAGGSARILGTQEPIFKIPFRSVMLLAASGELAVGVACLAGRFKLWPLGLVAWLATIFTLYRLGLWVVDYNAPCSCLGALSGALHLSVRAANQIALALLIYLLAGSYLLLAKAWHDSRRGVYVNSMKTGDQTG
jgi:hypothetical protein